MNMYVKYIYIHYVYKVQLSTYPHTKFDIFISDCLHIESYSWYGGHGLAQLQFVKYSYSVLRLQTQKLSQVTTLFQVENTRENVKIYTMNSFLILQNDSLFTSKILPESNQQTITLLIYIQMSTEFSTQEYFHGKKNSQDEKVIILIIVCKVDNS